MVRSTSKCPYCGYVIRKQKNPVHEIGVPFEKCFLCGKTYINSYKEEWITKSPIKRFFFFLQVGVWARAAIVPLLFLALLIIAFGVDMEGGVALALWFVMFAAWLIGGYFIHKNTAQNDIYKSLARTKNAEYLNLLKQVGYTIYPPK